jgi:hypothetical protein
MISSVEHFQWSLPHPQGNKEIFLIDIKYRFSKNLWDLGVGESDTNANLGQWYFNKRS